MKLKVGSELGGDYLDPLSIPPVRISMASGGADGNESQQAEQMEQRSMHYPRAVSSSATPQRTENSSYREHIHFPFQSCQ